jgi:hypothetical protein
MGSRAFARCARDGFAAKRCLEDDLEDEQQFALTSPPYSQRGIPEEVRRHPFGERISGSTTGPSVYANLSLERRAQMSSTENRSPSSASTSS